MSKIQFNKISESELEVYIEGDVPLQMVETLRKSLSDKGMVEDLSNSTLSTRLFYKEEDRVNDVADNLIKSLKGLMKDELPYWHPKAQREHQKKLRVADRNERRAKIGLPPAASPPTPIAKPKIQGPKAPVYDPSAGHTALGSGKRYAHIKDGVGKKEDKDSDVEKSNYGPKGMSQYSAVDNIKRKLRNTGDSVGEGPNVNVKSYSTKPGQLSARQQAAKDASKLQTANRKQPIKQYTAEEIQQINRERGFKKAWGQHLPFPSAIEELEKMEANDQTELGEDALSNQLADMMQSKNMFKVDQPSSEEFIAAGERMGFGVSEEMVKSEEGKWNNTLNNWLVEASKPISQRFSSEEEELAYWNSIKVAGADTVGPDDSQ